MVADSAVIGSFGKFVVFGVTADGQTPELREAFGICEGVAGSATKACGLM